MLIDDIQEGGERREATAIRVKQAGREGEPTCRHAQSKRSSRSHAHHMSVTPSLTALAEPCIWYRRESGTDLAENNNAYLLITLLIRGQPVPEFLVQVLDLLDGTLFAGDARDLGLELDAGLVPVLVACEQKHIIVTRTEDVGVGGVGGARR